MYSIKYTSSAKKEMKNLPKEIRKNINDGLEELTDDPYKHNIEKVNSSNKSAIFYKIRVGKYRAIFFIHNKALIILVMEVGKRSKVYRKW